MLLCSAAPIPTMLRPHYPYCLLRSIGWIGVCVSAVHSAGEGFGGWSIVWRCLAALFSGGGAPFLMVSYAHTPLRVGAMRGGLLGWGCTWTVAFLAVRSGWGRPLVSCGGCRDERTQRTAFSVASALILSCGVNVTHRRAIAASPLTKQ